MFGIIELRIAVFIIVLGLVRALLPAGAAQPVYTGNPVLGVAELFTAIYANLPMLGIRGAQLAVVVGFVRARLAAVAAQAIHAGNPVISPARFLLAHAALLPVLGIVRFINVLVPRGDEFSVPVVAALNRAGDDLLAILGAGCRSRDRRIQDVLVLNLARQPLRVREQAHHESQYTRQQFS